MQKSGSDHYHTRQSPDDVRFTKPTIDLNFPGQHEFENIYDVLRALEQKALQPRSLPSLRVFLHDNQLWTIDNKLLYIYRISPKVRRVSVTFISGVRFIDRFVNENSNSDLERMASPDFFPEVVRTTDELPVVNSSAQDCVLLPTVAGFKKMEEERISAGKANSPGSAKYFSSRSNSSSKTVASRVSSDDNDESHLTTGTETNSPYAKLPRACRVRNANRTPDSSTNSSVKSYPVQASNNCGSHKKERDPSPDSSTGQICPEYFGESTYFRLRQSTTEAHIRDLFSKIIQKEEPSQTPLSSSPCFTRAVVECRDIPVSNTLPPVHTLTEPINYTPRREADAGVADDHYHLVGSKQNMNTLQFRQQAESPVSARSNSPEELSKWREVDTPEAPPDMLGSFSARLMMMNQARSDNKVVTAAEERGQYQQQQQVPTNSRRGSPSKKRAETVSHTSSDSSKDRHSRLDRPLSSCGSSAAPVLERPSTCNFPLDGRKNGPLFRLCATSTVQPDRTNLSPPKARSRAFLTAEKKPQGKLSQEHELEVSKKILLRHMKKAFFSAY